MSKLGFVKRLLVLVCTVLGIGVALSIVPGFASDAPAQVTVTTSMPGHGAALAAATDHHARTVAWADGHAVARQDCGVCGGWWDEQEEEHYHLAAADPEGVFSRAAGWHATTPASGTCPAKHPNDCAGCYCPLLCGSNQTCLDECVGQCPPPGGGFASLLESVRSGSARPHDVAAAYVNFEINEERHALQAIGCRNAVIAHIPLNSTPADVGNDASAHSPAGKDKS